MRGPYVLKILAMRISMLKEYKHLKELSVQGNFLSDICHKGHEVVINNRREEIT